VTRYTQVVTACLMQSVACNSLHTVTQRCCRWLLSACDRVENTHLSVTQQLLATAISVHRPTMTIVLGRLQAAGLITRSHGKITLFRS
jgi:CRP-like cAMP-binding protein